MSRLSGTGLAVLLPLLTASGLDGPLDLANQLGHRLHGRPLVHIAEDKSRERGLTKDLAHGLAWVRDHTRPDDVLAVNSFYRDPSTSDTRYVYFSAFTERRVYLEGWAYTPAALAQDREGGAGGAAPYPERLALVQAAFRRADPTALLKLHRAGVRFLVADLAHLPKPSPRLRESTDLVFANPDVEVFRLRRSRTPL